ncbi:hypothetical protein AKJ16_DCAP03472 [Drosera capensis]
MIHASSTISVSCNHTQLSSQSPNPKTLKPQRPNLAPTTLSKPHLKPSFNHNTQGRIFVPLKKLGLGKVSCSGSKSAQIVEKGVEVSEEEGGDGGEGGGGGGGEERDWSTSVLLFVFWGAVLFYVFNFAPNQTPSRDLYFVQKLSNLKGDDGFRMNQVLVSLWYIMGLWPVVYSMLLLPTGRSTKSNIPVWPFLVLSFFGGAYALLPYFILWKPPSAAVEEAELRRWPLNFLESKITAGVVAAAGLGLIIYAGLAIGDWKEFYQYTRESKLVHATTLDFALLSTFAPFWVYNDMTARKCYDKYSWILPFCVIPFMGPALYIFLRPSPSTVEIPVDTTVKSD